MKDATVGWVLIAFSSFVYALLATGGAIFFNSAWINEGWWWHTAARAAVIVSAFLWANCIYAAYRAAFHR